MMSKKWLAAGLALSMTASLALAGCSEKTDSTDTGETTGADEEQVLNLVTTDEIPTMDMSKMTDTISFTAVGQTNEGLTRIGKDGKITGGVAEKWEVSPDGLKWTFKLRNNAKWSNGDPVTAKDFEYSWKRTLDPKTGGEYAFLVAWVKGGEEFNAGKTTNPDDVKVKATDDYTLEVELVRPVPFFPDLMSFPTFFPQNQKVVEQHGDKYGGDFDKMVYNGPFKMTAWEHEASAKFEKNENYWDKDAVKLDSFTYTVVKESQAAVNLFESDQIDRTSPLVRDLVDTYKDTPEFSTITELTTGYVLFNNKRDYLKNAKIRQALAYAVDGDAYADIVYHNGTTGATGLIPPSITDGEGGSFRKNNGDLMKRSENLAKAKGLLAEGLKELGLEKLPKMKLTGDDGDVGRKGGEFIQEQWRKNLGVEIDVELVPFKMRLDKTKNQDYDVAISLWNGDYNDAMTFLDMYLTESGFNYPAWSNAEYDALVKKAQAEVDAKKRQQIMLDAEKLFMKEMPVAPLFFRARAHLMKTYVKDFQVTTNGPDYSLKYTYIQGKK